MGRIIKKHVGPDGHTRAVDIKTATNTLTRTITKVAPLPVNESKKTQRSSVSSLITTMLALVTIKPTVIKAETSVLDVTKTAIEGAVKAYTSDTTKEWLGAKKIQNYSWKQIQKINENLNTPAQKQQSSEFSWFIITVMIGVCGLLFAIILFYKLCIGWKKSRKYDWSSNSSLSYETERANVRRLRNHTKRLRSSKLNERVDTHEMQNHATQSPMANEQQSQILHEFQRMTEVQIKTMRHNERKNSQRELHETAQVHTIKTRTVNRTPTPIPMPRITHGFVNDLEA